MDIITAINNHTSESYTCTKLMMEDKMKFKFSYYVDNKNEKAKIEIYSESNKQFNLLFELSDLRGELPEDMNEYPEIKLAMVERQLIQEEVFEELVILCQTLLENYDKPRTTAR